MKTIYKYELSPEYLSIEMPKNAEILCVQVQRNTPCLWAVVDSECEEKEFRNFEIYGTGHCMKEADQKYIGTFQMSGGSLVFHVFEITNKTKEISC